LVDIHSHLLYGMDDGARTLEDSVAMARMAIEHGTTDLIATPHANLRYRFEPELIRGRLAEIAEAAGSALRLYSGCDFHLSYDNIQDAIANPIKYTLNQKCYLLVEFSDLIIFQNTPEIFARLQESGMVPVITHPERNALLQQRLPQIEHWVESGACVQVTAGSLLGVFGRNSLDFSRILLDRGLVHFIASDAHNCDRRSPRLDEASAWLKTNYGESLAETLCVTNPRAALEGELLTSRRGETFTPRRKWYEIWR
jgi:protein-tyrosine phosphatase